MKIKNILAVAAVLLPLAAAGQDLDPTVEVSRVYEGKLMEVHKPQLRMAVPDSVLHFDLDFDYSVTDTPYKGAYEFSPYSLDMRPSPAVYKLNSLYVKAGAGYQLHPVFDLIWSPKFKRNAFRMNVYASHRSFVGNYWKMAEPVLDKGTVVLDRVGKDAAGNRSWAGYDLDSKAGVDGRYDWEKGLAWFDVSYTGLNQKDSYIYRLNRYYYALDGKIGIASKKRTGFMYKFDAAYSFAEDNLSFLNNDTWYQKAAEFDINSSWGYLLDRGGKIVVDVDVNTASLVGAADYSGVDVDVVPHYVMSSGRWDLDLGVRISAALSSGRFTAEQGVEGQLLYPDVKIAFKAVKDALKMYLDISGDSELNSYSDLVAYNRRAYSGYAGIGMELVDVSEEKINARIGAEGRIGPHFSYDLRGGYVKYADVLMDGVQRRNTVPAEPAYWLPTLGYGSYDKAFVALDWFLDMGCVRFDGGVEYARSRAVKSADVKGLFLPAAVRGDIAFSYNWNKRIFAGVDCEFSTARRGSAMHYEEIYGGPIELEYIDARIPGYADLGLSAEFAVNRRFSVWARGGNLLGMTIQRSLLYAEKGPYFTAGVCLNL